jgi:hypothetical protein
MIVRVSARGQANGSADGYLCARARRQAEYKMRTVELVESYRVLSKLFLEEIEI